MPSWREIERFCQKDGWTQTKKKGHYIYFEKVTEDGSVKRTKVSRGTGEVKGHLWKEILKNNSRFLWRNLIKKNK